MLGQRVKPLKLVLLSHPPGRLSVLVPPAEVESVPCACNTLDVISLYLSSLTDKNVIVTFLKLMSDSPLG